MLRDNILMVTWGGVASCAVRGTAPRSISMTTQTTHIQPSVAQRSGAKRWSPADNPSYYPTNTVPQTDQNGTTVNQSNQWRKATALVLLGMARSVWPSSGTLLNEELLVSPGNARLLFVECRPLAIAHRYIRESYQRHSFNIHNLDLHEGKY